MNSYQNDVMPTNEWFEKIKAHVDFKGKSVVDYGCAEGIMSKLAKEAGAKYVCAIDNQEHYQPSEGVIFLKADIDERIVYGEIKIFSMIIHWIDKDETLKHIQDCEKAIIIFREKNPGYQIPINGKWFPTLDELDETLDGFRRVHSELLMVQDNDKRITLAIYEKDLH